MQFNVYIKQRRRELNLSIRKLEEITGISNAYISQLENNLRGIPSIEIINKLSLGLQIPKEFLFRVAIGENQSSLFEKLSQLSLSELSRVEEYVELLLNDKRRIDKKKSSIY